MLSNISFTNTISENIFTIGMYVVSFLLGGVLILITKFKTILNAFKQEKGLKTNFLTLHSQLDECLTELRIRLKACRASIIKFHNGGHYLDGASIMKFTTTHESRKNGVESSKDTSQGLLITRFIDMIELSQRDNPMLIWTIDLKDTHFKGYQETKGTIAFSILPLKSHKGLNLGYIICEWCTYDNVEDLVQEEISHEMWQYRRMINSILLAENE